MNSLRQHNDFCIKVNDNGPESIVPFVCFCHFETLFSCEEEEIMYIKDFILKNHASIKDQLKGSPHVKSYSERGGVEPQSDVIPGESGISQQPDIVSQSFNPFGVFVDPLGLKKISEQIPVVVETIGDKLPGSREREDFVTLLKNFGEKVPSLPFGGTSSKALESAAGLFNGLDKLSPTVLTVIAVAFHAHQRTWLSFGFLVGSFVYFIIKTPSQIGYLLNLYFKYNEVIPMVPDIDMDEVEPQIANSSLELIGTLIATTLVGYVSGSRKIDPSVIVLNFVKDFSRAKSGMIELAKLILTLVEGLVNLVREKFLDLPSIRFIDTCSSEIDMFSKDVRQISHSFNKGLLPITEDMYSKISCLYGVGSHLIKVIPRDKFSEPSLKLLHQDHHALQKIMNEFERMDMSLRGMRQEPNACLLAGGPGVAKSIAALYLSYIWAQDVLSDDEKEEFNKNPARFIYSRKQELVFFDSLTNLAKVFFYDDFLQARDIAGNPNCEAMEIIRIVNTEEYSAHMAHLENKGNVYVRPKHVIATTNQPDLTSKAIVSTEALKRRFNMSYIVVPNEKYTRDQDLGNDYWNRKVDPNKLPQSEIITSEDNFVQNHIISDLRPEHLNFIEYNLITEEIGNVCTFSEVIAMGRKQELIRRRRFALHKQNFKDLTIRYAKVFETSVQEEVLDDNYSFDPNAEEDADSDCESVYSSSVEKASEEEFLDLTSMLYLKLSYVGYLRTCMKSRDDTSIENIAFVLVEVFGYVEAYDIVKFERKFPKGYKFPKKKFKVIVRAFVSIKDRVQRFLDELPSWQEFYAQHSGKIDGIVTFLGCLLATGLLKFLGNWLYSWWTGKTVPQSFGHSDRMRTPKVNPKFVKNSQAIKQFISANPQFGEDTSGIDLITSIVRRNSFKMETMGDGGNWNVCGTFTFVRGRIGVMPYHFIVKFIEGIEEDSTRLKRLVKLSHGKTDDNNPGLLVTVEEILQGHQFGCLGQNDLVLVEMPKRIPERFDIVDKFAIEKDLDYNSVNLEIMVPMLNRPSDHFYFGSARKYPDIVAVNKIVGYPYVIERSFIYDIPTKPGDCGAPFCVLNSSLQKRKIFGFHVAGHTHNGDAYAGVITQEMLQEDLKLFQEQVVSETIDLVEPQMADLNKPLRFEILGRTPLSPMRNTVTSITRSRLYGKLGPVDLRPAMLRPTVIDEVLIDPLLNSQMNYCSPDVYFDHTIVKECVDDTFAHMEWKSNNRVDRRLFTLDEAVFGLEFDTDYSAVSSSTSSGWPMNVSGQRDLKKELFACEFGSTTQQIVFEEVRIKVEELIVKATNNIRMFHVFTDNNKDELREHHKYLAGSTRLFSGCPFIYLLVFRMYFGAFSLWFTKNRINNGSAVGVNPYSSEWNTIAKHLCSVSIFNIGAGDHKKFDGSQKPVIHLFILNCINLWYDDGPINARIRCILWMEIYNSRHICDGLVYEWLSGLCSGHPFTIIINTIYNLVIARYVWIRSTKKRLEFNNNVYVIGQGDDIVYAVSEDFKELFNDVLFAKFAKELGMTYTNETKDGSIFKLRHLTEIDFLKRSFSYDSSENLWIAPLKLKSILKMIDWTRKKHKNAIMSQNVMTCVRELSLHEKDIFDRFSRKVINLFRDNYPTLTTSGPLDLDYRARRAEVLQTICFF